MSALNSPLFHFPIGRSSRDSSALAGVPLSGLIDPVLGSMTAHEIAAAWRRETGADELTGGTLLAGGHWLVAVAMLAFRLIGDEVQADRLFSQLADDLGAESLNDILSRLDLSCSGIVLDRSDSDQGLPNDGAPDKRAMLARLAVLTLALRNPALETLNKALGLNGLKGDPGIDRLLQALPKTLATLRIIPDKPHHAWDVLSAPIVEAPGELDRQLLSIAVHWSSWIGDLGEACALAAGTLREERRPHHQGHGESRPFLAPEFPSTATESSSSKGHTDQDPAPPPVEDIEIENFTEDRSWMPQVILLAKNIHVWLHQLSRRYNRAITTLDQIPGEELDRIAAQGITGLWLIGLWQRSAASRDIKRRMGNTEALASAYAIEDYRIAGDLGGDDALDDLRWKAMERGIRLCGDMVPNHTGIDGRWVIERPDLFVNLDHAPYPAYGFEGPDLSRSSDVEIKIEDHYWDRSDAAVVFRHHNRRDGRTRYIYHGNDGTSMPWNDTAQLDFLNPETRETVIQAILDVARRFPIIRFDAAMVLARRHVRRLWHPEPGEASDVATRSWHAMSRAEFDAAMPREFWREVVDRIAVEAPDTLLMAEAFWMLEGYFVRTLGMHRVYNSAFMHMLRDQENAKFRSSLRNVIEFDPRILQRHVNFVTNPDEETADEQFGKGDKYFGICTMLATLPGLPMLGHGQLEGLSEKYGMEYGRSYHEESPDEGLLAYHERMIFPLFRRRSLFSGADHFRLYDAHGSSGEPIEDIIAFSNRTGRDRVLVVYNNCHEYRRGRIDHAFAGEGTPGVRLGEELDLGEVSGNIVFIDPRHPFEMSVQSEDLRQEGLTLELPPYGCRVFTEFRSE